MYLMRRAGEGLPTRGESARKDGEGLGMREEEREVEGVKDMTGAS